MTLTEFLLARIAEDEAAARVGGADAMTGQFWKQFESDAYDEIQALALQYARRLATECEAKRRIVDMFRAAEADRSGTSDFEVVLDNVLRMLALPYADHSDYRQEWKP